MNLATRLANVNPFRRNGTPAPPPNPDEREGPRHQEPAARVQMVRGRYESARQAKMPLLGTWVTCLALITSFDRR